MREYIVKSNDAGQRMSKLLLKYLNKAPASFVYKMLRKKNIVLNGKKAEGTELLKEGDVIRLFLSDETIDGFREAVELPAAAKRPASAKHSDRNVLSQTSKEGNGALRPEWIVYEDENVLIINKPFGVLSQRAEKTDVSLVEMLTAYLLETHAVTREELETFHPSICNRLDRNTSGLVIAGKTLKGLQTMTEIVRARKVKKFYNCIVCGKVPDGRVHVKAYLHKDVKTNKVKISPVKTSDEDERIETIYSAKQHFPGYTLLEVELLTGKTHQIRAQLAAGGYPIVGDEKYGNHQSNLFFRKEYGLKNQLLTACRLEFPVMEAPFEQLSGRTVRIALPEEFDRVKKTIGF